MAPGQRDAPLVPAVSAAAARGVGVARSALPALAALVLAGQRALARAARARRRPRAYS